MEVVTGRFVSAEDHESEVARLKQFIRYAIDSLPTDCDLQVDLLTALDGEYLWQALRGWDLSKPLVKP